MSVLNTQCPSCGGPVEFTSGSTIVRVCPYCRSVIARTDRGVADLGKIAEVAESSSPLKLGLKGEYQGNRFELTGRAQMRHTLGGTWDEWYATFSNGWVGWLAEAQGNFYLTFFQPTPAGASLPSFESMTPGSMVELIAGQKMVVQERGTAEYASAEGEIPYQLTPGEKFDFVDLAGHDSAFATVDYSLTPPWLFYGKQVSLSDIGLADAKPVTREARSVTGAALSCPNCGGPLSLTAPDRAERVTCPHCRSLLDVNDGNLKYLHALAPPANAPSFVLAIGTSGVFGDGKQYKIIGAMARSVTFDGVKYYWHEYLLYNPGVGFRWLVHSDNHWNFVKAINASDVEQPSYITPGATAKYDGKAFKVFQDAIATVEYVEGEFYWRVEQGEAVRTIDYVAAPRMLSQEVTQNEINWSVGEYMTNAEVEKILGVTDLPKPWGVAPDQPFTGSFYYTWGALPLIGLIGLALLLLPLTGLTSTVLNQQILLPPLTASGQPQTMFSQKFDIKANKNIRITASAPVNNSWADIDVDLVNEQSQDVESVNIPVEFYSGSDSDGAWSEGGQSSDATISSLPAGAYTLRVEGTWEQWQNQMPVQVKVEQSVNRGVNFICAFISLILVPLFGIFRKFTFETARWKDSMFSGSSGSGDDSDE